MTISPNDPALNGLPLIKPDTFTSNGKPLAIVLGYDGHSAIDLSNLQGLSSAIISWQTTAGTAPGGRWLTVESSGGTLWVAGNVSGGVTIAGSTYVADLKAGQAADGVERLVPVDAGGSRVITPQATVGSVVTPAEVYSDVRALGTSPIGWTAHLQAGTSTLFLNNTGLAGANLNGATEIAQLSAFGTAGESNGSEYRLINGQTLTLWGTLDGTAAPNNFWAVTGSGPSGYYGTSDGVLTMVGQSAPYATPLVG